MIQTIILDGCRLVTKFLILRVPIVFVTEAPADAKENACPVCPIDMAISKILGLFKRK